MGKLQKKKSNKKLSNLRVLKHHRCVKRFKIVAHISQVED